ncbi:unnamed protein product [Cuscuta epithymum]|uniref:Uncharacterized protein n=1 Tax=Cuscuta epithymum TaxID=186058 RepID=A0AAV0CFJ0_9ASTE|nr:unnamed protein product [Cuscuta epithymum]
MGRTSAWAINPTPSFEDTRPILGYSTCWDILSRPITVHESKALRSTEPEQLGPFRPIRPTVAIWAHSGPCGPLGWRASPSPILYKYRSFPPYYGSLFLASSSSF